MGEPAPAVRPIRSLARAAADYIWAYDVERGMSPKAIAAREGLSVRAIRKGISRARRHDRGMPQVNTIREPSNEPRLVPLFPVGPFTPDSTCPHAGIRPSPPFVCMVCHRSYADDHPAVRPPDRSARAAPTP